MVGYRKERTVVFFVARCHADLSWYLSFNASSPAANDPFMTRPLMNRTQTKRARAGASQERGLVLRLVLSQSN